MRRIIPSAGTAALVVSLVAASVVATAGAADASTPADRLTLSIHTSSTHTVVAPTTLRPGIVHVRNTGSHPIYVLKEIHDGLATAVTDLQTSATGDSPGPLIVDFTMIDLIDAHTEAYLPITAGTVYLSDASLEHYAVKNVHTVAVSGNAVNAALPSSRPVTIGAAGRLSAPKTMPHSIGALHIVNGSAALQEVIAVRVPAKVTANQLAALVAHPSVSKLDALHPTAELLAGLVSSHHGLYFAHSFAAARFVVLSLAFTSHTSEPKIGQGALRVITVK